MPTLPTLEEMLKAGLHFGHQKDKWHPKMEQYIFAERNGVHIIDLEKTQIKLQAALQFITNTVKAGGVILFVGTKDQAKDSVTKAAQDCGMPYVSNRWLGGTLTNFPIILKLIKKYKDLKAKQETGGFKGYTKKEQLDFQEDIVKLEGRVGGIKDLKKAPDAIFLVDAKHEKTALTEAKKKGITLVVLCDTNINPTKIDYVIPGNDDATKGIEMIVALVAEAVKEGKALQGK
ncbi:30S ribosomal protein S2 [Candidatus Falkowbacteria bacterium]|nr:30S ribosomal protein S2 [Candidatus Falkowbacteria bacterium]